MKVSWAVPVIASILILGAFTVGYSFDDAFAGKDDNNGNKGCEKSNPNAKPCEKNPNADPPLDPFDGNLRIFVNDGNDNGFSGIECKVYSGLDGCPFLSVPFDQGTTDQLGNLSFIIPPEELDDVTVECDLSGVGGLAGFWYFVDVPMTSIPNPPFDFNINDGTNMCCPT